MPLVNRLLQGYRCAQLLVRLPGDIPIPSFSTQSSLPSHLWTNADLNTFLPEIKRSLSSDVAALHLHSSIPFPENIGKRQCLPRRVIQSPLIVRHPSKDAYALAGRERILQSVGVPSRLRKPEIKVLIVSFGGQTFRKPNSRTHSRSHSPHGSRTQSTAVSRTTSTESTTSVGGALNKTLARIPQNLMTESHILIPGAPPAKKVPNSEEQFDPAPLTQKLNNVEGGGGIEERSSQGLQLVDQDSCSDSFPSDHDPHFLPDSNWIAIICGATAKKEPDDSPDDELPQNFFLAPRDVYMPDLTAVADVLLGKLGYGTVSECVDAATPFVFVSRPLFVEEHGLRALLEREGAGVELSREKYEAGEWAAHVATAYDAGRELKRRRRARGNDDTRKIECAQLAGEIVDWLLEWQRADSMEAAPSTPVEPVVVDTVSERGRRLPSCSFVPSPSLSFATPPASPIRIHG